MGRITVKNSVVVVMPLALCLLSFCVFAARPRLNAQRPAPPVLSTVTIHSSHELLSSRLTAVRDKHFVITPTSSQTFLLCNVTVQNNTIGPTSFVYRLVDASGYEWDDISVPVREVKAKMIPAPIASGATATGHLLFRVRRGVQPVRINALIAVCGTEEPGLLYRLRSIF